jgi:hypothetical protein
MSKLKIITVISNLDLIKISKAIIQNHLLKKIYLGLFNKNINNTYPKSYNQNL